MFLKIKKFLNENYLFFIILSLFLFVRLYDISNLTTFGGDQGVDFLTIREMVLYKKWTLIGIKTSIAPFFQGPLYLYILYPFFYFLNLNPIAGALCAVTLSTLSIILFYILVKKYFSKNSANLGGALFASSPELVIYGNTPLYQNFLPLFIIGALYLFLLKKKSLLNYMLLGFVLGLGMEVHFLNVSLVAAIFVIYTFWQKISWKKLLGYVFGILLGLLPTIFFELRHDFLNSRLLLDYISNGEKIGISLNHVLNQWIFGSARFLAGNNFVVGTMVLLFSLYYLFSKKKVSADKNGFNVLALVLFLILNLIGFIFSAFGPEYPLPFWIILFIVIPVAALEIFPKRIGHLLVLVLILFNLFVTLGRLDNKTGYNMTSGFTLNKITKAGKIVSDDVSLHQNFNLASLLEGSTRAYPLRYTVLINGQKPADVTDYPNNNHLYLLAGSKKESIFESDVWEIKSFKPFKIGQEWDLNDNIYLYRLDRILAN